MDDDGNTNDTMGDTEVNNFGKEMQVENEEVADPDNEATPLEATDRSSVSRMMRQTQRTRVIRPMTIRKRQIP